MYKEIQEKINSLHELDNIEDLTFEEFLSDILHMTEEDYIKCVRSSLSGANVFLQRKPYEVRVNPYMKVVLPAWKTNHDLQFVLDPYACAMYIVSYISKSQKGMSALLDQAAKEAKEGNLDLKRQVRHIGNYFVNSVETSAQEAAYLTLQMPLTKATRQVVFINTSPPDKRTFLLKKTSELEKMSKDSTDIESNNDIKRYSKRPKALENWCLADYISQLQVNFPKNIKENDEQYSDNESESSASENEEDTNDGTKRIKITLKNGVTIGQRKTCVIRYPSFNKNTNSENYFRERLVLFYPWREEGENLKKDCETFEQMYQTVHRTVDRKAKQYEKNVEELERAIEQAEGDNNQYDELAPGTQQVECEDIEEGTTDAEQYIYFNPDRPTDHTNYDLGDDLGVANTTVEITSHAKRMVEDEFHNLIRCLNVKQREFFQHVITWVKTKEEPLFAFPTGGAGVGKSVVVRAVFQGLHRHLCAEEGEDPDDIRVLLCAPTGKAAYNIHGLTIHNAFQIQPNKGLDRSLSCDVLNRLRMKYRNLSVILIDEISMVGNRMFSLIESRLRRIKGNNQTFGGVSLIAIGDFFQLKPVFNGWIFDDIALYLGNDCVCETTSSFSNSDVEFIMADVISCSKGHIQVAIVYKEPRCKLQDLKEIMMSQLLPKLDLKHSNIAIFGDFNINLLNGNVDFLNFMERTFGCKGGAISIKTHYIRKKKELAILQIASLSIFLFGYCGNCILTFFLIYCCICILYEMKCPRLNVLTLVILYFDITLCFNHIFNDDYFTA